MNNEGAKLVAGGTGKPDDLENGYYVKPTVFGKYKQYGDRKKKYLVPFFQLYHTSEDEAVEIANDTEYGLAAYVSGSDNERMKAIARKTSGTNPFKSRGAGPNAPFGGFKQSGNGREKAEWGLEEFLSKSYNALKTWGALKGSPNLMYSYSSSGKIKFNTTATGSYHGRSCKNFHNPR